MSTVPGPQPPPSLGESAACATGKMHRFQVEVPRLDSTFALDQLTGLEHFKQRIEFIAWLIYIFGGDIPLKAYDALRDSLAKRTFRNPKIRIVPQLPGGHGAAYDRATHQILVQRALVDRARKDRGEAWGLMIALVEEFGHHVDYMLRRVYSQVGGDGPRDEGAVFAHAIVLLRYDRAKSTPFADWIHGGRREALHVDHTKMHEAMQRWLNDEALNNDEQTGSLKFFPADGKGKPGVSFGHEQIENVLPRGGIDAGRVREVYFGNWLRDYSQLVDPKLIRPPKSTKTFLSREALTNVVNVLAEAKFGSSPLFLVTTSRLGVYRPEEHIDNPMGLDDATGIDPAFSKGYSPTMGAIDPVSRLKVYIKDSVQYMCTELLLAKNLGPTPEGHRRLGQALHTLEDYFAHSNFVEVALIKNGFVTVVPWTAPMANGCLPIVTGSFGGNDTMASLLLELGAVLKENEPFEPGRRTKSQKILLIVVRDWYPDQAKSYEMFLDFKEDFEIKHPWIFWGLYHTVGRISSYISWIFGAIFSVVGNNIDEAQTVFNNNPSSTDPTHTQLAKDHDDHPLHTLAASLAEHAIVEVAKTVVTAWLHPAPDSEQTIVRVASSYICHPLDTTWMDVQVRSWAVGHHAEITRASSKTWLEHFQKQHWDKMRKKAESLFGKAKNALRLFMNLFGSEK